jgi:hypothetical protein
MRLEDIDNCGQRTDVPCMRCLGAFARGDLHLYGQNGCWFPDVASDSHNSLAWSSFVDDDAKEQYYRCKHCLNIGQDCFAVRLALIGVDWTFLTSHSLYQALRSISRSFVPVPTTTTVASSKS